MRWEPTTWLASCATALLLAQAAPAPDGAAFERDFAAVRDLVDAGKFAPAKQALLDLVARHGDQPHVRLRAREIRDELTRCAVRVAVPRPDPAKLVSGKLTRNPLRGGMLEIRYGAEQLADFVPIAGTAKQFDGTPVKLHPAAFRGPFSVELEAPILPAVGWISGGQSSFFVFDGDQVVASATFVGNWNGPARTNVLLRAAGKGRVDGELNEFGPRELEIKPGKTARVRLSVSSDEVTLSVGGRTLLEVKKEKERWGQFGYHFSGKVGELELEGPATTAWLDGLVDAAVLAAEEEFLDEFDVASLLPDWLESEHDDVAAMASIDLGPRFEATPAQSTLLSAVRYHRLAGDARKALALVRSRGEAALPDDVRDWEIGTLLIELREEAALAAHLENLRARDAKSEVAYLLRGMLLVDLGNHREAIDYLARVAKGMPDEPRLAVLLARSHLLARDADGALAALRAVPEALRASPMVAALEAAIVAARRGPGFARRVELATRHFQLVSDLDDATCAKAGRVAEDAHGQYERFFGPRGDARLLPIALFSGQAGYLEFLRAIGSAPAHSTAGLYHKVMKQLLVWNLPDRDDTWQTLRHELCHQYLDELGWRPPRWFDEGMAEYASQLSWKGIATVDAGAIEPGLLARAKRVMTDRLELAGFLRLTPSRFYAGGTGHYAQAFALIHFLRHGGAPAKGIYDKLVAAMRAGKAENAVVDEAFAGVDLALLDDAFGAYVMRLK